MSKEINGKYFGTEINEKWWKRYTKEKMFSRGNGTFSYNDNSISFLRLLNKNPIDIQFKEIVEFKTGKWHSGKWGRGRQIIKVIWKKDSQILSSGFSISKNSSELFELISELENYLKKSGKDII